MSDATEIKGFISKAKVDHAKLEKKLFNTRKKIDEIQNQLEENESLQAFLHESVED